MNKRETKNSPPTSVKARADRFLSLLLVLCLVAGLMPAMSIGAAADDTPHEHDGVTFTTALTQAMFDNGDVTLASGTYYLSENIETPNKLLVPSSSTVKLCLNGEVFTYTAAANREYDGTKTVAITGGALDGLVTNDTVTLSGTPTGEVTSANKGDNKSVTVSGYAAVPLSWASAKGLISGTGAGLLDPRGTATRAQVAAILHRFCENIA